MSACYRAVSGRKPFGQDVELDYEVMSDQDWEEEPEGESLSVSSLAPQQASRQRVAVAAAYTHITAS